MSSDAKLAERDQPNWICSQPGCGEIHDKESRGREHAATGPLPVDPDGANDGLEAGTPAPSTNLDALRAAFRKADAEAFAKCFPPRPVEQAAYAYIAALESDNARLEKENNVFGDAIGNWEVTSDKYAEMWRAATARAEKAEAERAELHELYVEVLAQRNQALARAEKAEALVAAYEREPDAAEMQRLYSAYFDASCEMKARLHTVIAKWREICRERAGKGVKA